MYNRNFNREFNKDNVKFAILVIEICNDSEHTWQVVLSKGKY